MKIKLSTFNSAPARREPTNVLGIHLATNDRCQSYYKFGVADGLELAALLWDQKRYRGWKKAIIQQGHASSLEHALLITNTDFQAIGSKPVTRAQARQDAREYKQSNAGREKFRPRLEAMGYDTNGLYASGFVGSATALAAIEQLLSSTRRQIASLLTGVLVRREFRNRARLFAAQQARLKTSVASDKDEGANGV